MTHSNNAHTAAPSTPPVRYLKSFACAAGGTNIFRFLGAIKELQRRNIKARHLSGASAGCPTSVIYAHDIDADIAVKEMLRLINRRMDMGLLLRSLVYPDFQRWLLSGQTCWTPRESYREFLEVFDIRDWPDHVNLEFMACAVKLPEYTPATPWNLTNYPHRPLHLDRNSGYSMLTSMVMSGSAPGLAVPEVINTAEHGRELVVDGAVWNFIPRLPEPSLVVKAHRITDISVKMPQGIEMFDPMAWTRFMSDSQKLFKTPLDFMYQFLEVKAPLAADRRHVSDEHLVLAFGDEKDGTLKPAGLNTGAEAAIYLRMYESAQEQTAMILDQAEKDNKLAQYLEA